MQPALTQVADLSLSWAIPFDRGDGLPWSQGALSIAKVARPAPAAIDGAADGESPTRATIRSASKARRMSNDNIAGMMFQPGDQVNVWRLLSLRGDFGSA